MADLFTIIQALDDDSVVMMGGSRDGVVVNQHYYIVDEDLVICDPVTHEQLDVLPQFKYAFIVSDVRERVSVITMLFKQTIAGKRFSGKPVAMGDRLKRGVL